MTVAQISRTLLVYFSWYGHSLALIPIFSSSSDASSISTQAARRFFQVWKRKTTLKEKHLHIYISCHAAKAEAMAIVRFAWHNLNPIKVIPSTGLQNQWQWLSIQTRLSLTRQCNTRAGQGNRMTETGNIRDCYWANNKQQLTHNDSPAFGSAQWKVKWSLMKKMRKLRCFFTPSFVCCCCFFRDGCCCVRSDVPTRRRREICSSRKNCCCFCYSQHPLEQNIQNEAGERHRPSFNVDKRGIKVLIS